MINAVIFDMDGLLIDSEPLWQKSFAKTFSILGTPTDKNAATETMGFKIDETVDYWYEQAKHHKISKAKLKKHYLKETKKLIASNGQLLPGAIHALTLVAKNKIPIAIASSSPRVIIEEVVEKFNLGEFIQIIHSADQEKNGKPAPDIYVTTSKLLKTPTERCVAFEDSPNGLTSAKAAKMKCVIVPNQISGSDERFEKADLIINSLEDLTMEILAKL